MYPSTSTTFLVTLSVLLFGITVVRSADEPVTALRRNARRAYVPDHPDWEYLNGIPWYITDPTQQDHARKHSYLSMSVYGDYATTCRKSFLGGFYVLQSFAGGYIAQVPEMDKIVIVLKGSGSYDSIDWTPVSIQDIVAGCPGCQAARGIKSLYLQIKALTNDFAVAKQAVVRTGLRFSVTGHGIGGSLAALCGLDLGARGLIHYSHNQGMPRTFNMPSIIRYDNLFQVLAGQSAVSRNDYSVQIVPPGPLYHVGSKLHLTGDKNQWLTNCYGNNENSTCLGTGNNFDDHKYYFTPLGQCGSADKGF